MCIVWGWALAVGMSQDLGFAAQTGKTLGSPPKLAKPWVATQTGLRPKSRPWARRPNWPKGRVNARALWTPALFNCALPLAGYFPAAPASAANAAAARYSHFGFEPARKKTLAVSHHSFDVVLKAARDFLVRNLTADCYLKNAAKFG
jgi:hypothetical protein